MPTLQVQHQAQDGRRSMAHDQVTEDLEYEKLGFYSEPMGDTNVS